MYSKLDIQYNRAIYLIKKAEKILIVGHKKPDSDAVGALIALSLFLEKFNKETVLSFNDPLPCRFNFLENSQKIVLLDKVRNNFLDFDVIITVDCGSYGLTGLDNIFFKKADVSLINIDHHHDCSNFGAINIVDSNASSTAELVYNLFTRVGFIIDKKIATALLCGIFGDTDSFKNPNTTDRTLEITSNLLAAGADLGEIVRNTLSDKSVNTLRLWGKVLSRLKRHKESGIIFTVVTKDDIIENNVSFSDIEGIANFLNSIPEAKGSLVISERENGEIKGSLRTLSNKIDVSRIAHLFGGGGHKKAAGFSIKGKLIMENERWKII